MPAWQSALKEKRIAHLPGTKKPLSQDKDNGFVFNVKMWGASASLPSRRIFTCDDGEQPLKLWRDKSSLMRWLVNER